MKKLAANYTPSGLNELKMSNKKKNDLMNVYFQNGQDISGNPNASIGELDTVESQGLIMNQIKERGIRNESNIAAKYGG